MRNDWALATTDRAERALTGPTAPASGLGARRRAQVPAESGLGEEDRRLIGAIQDGQPLVPRPYAEIGRRAGLSEAAVIGRLDAWLDSGLLKRFGVVVRHRPLGYQANAMLVFDVPDADVGEAGRRLAACPAVNLCYRRPRRGALWPYNLYCMIHGRDRERVEAEIERIVAACGLAGVPRAVLFSRRCFKQRGAHYLPNPAPAGCVPAELVEP